MLTRLGHRSGLAALVLAVALFAAACGGDDDGGGSGSGGGQNLSGSVKVSGSSTVEPITRAVAEKFSEDNPNVQISVEGPGTGDGFKLFCNGETDVSDASRQINDEEVAACQSKGIQYIEMQVGIDGISVLTSKQDPQPACLSDADLYALLGPESQGFKKWSDANKLAKEVGGKGGFPDKPLVVTAPGEESGTYDSFVALALAGVAEKRVEAKKITEDQAAATRKDYTASPNDNVIIEGIAGNPSSLGWVGFAFYEQNMDKVRAIQVAGKDGACVAPTADTIKDGSYSLSRPLFIYVNKAKADASPALKSFVDFYLSDDGLASVTEAKYVAMSDAAKQKTLDTWKTQKTGKQAS
ncbi:MAG TPA: phosphate ABC transporter substrate-binding protein PstS family protein [Actinomycetes bacterium]|nr:phosphate ABC transporter substrate-binding protein PstS family protein [Actinomycetes bacterium]